MLSASLDWAAMTIAGRPAGGRGSGCRNNGGLVRPTGRCGRQCSIDVTFDEQRGYVGTAAALPQPVVALPLVPSGAR